MDSVPGDQWIGEYARWLRVHEAKLGDVAASAAAAKRNASRDAPASTLSSTFWNVVSLGTANVAPANGSSPARPSSTASSSASSTLTARPMLLRQNPHNLYYLLIRFEALGLQVGSLDTKIPIAARPTSYFSFVAATSADKDRDDTMSMSSMRSRISVVSSSFSSSLSWFGTSTSKPDPSRDVKYIYSCFTKIPSLRLGPIPARKLIRDFEDCPGQSAVPLDVFKNLQMLELDDVDPRTLIGWDRICIQLRSLTCKKSNIEDLTDLLVDLVIIDTKRRRGEKVNPRRFRRAPPAADITEDLSASSTTASNTDAEDNLTDADASAEPTTEASTLNDPAAAKEAIPTLPKDMPSIAWHFLRYLNLASNNLTFVPVEPLLCLSGLINLDLSSNLLNVVPPSLSHLTSLTSLNISDNLIDSVLGIYDALPAIRVLNLAKNRLESLCGLERLYTLRRIDLRGNAIYESGEVGRLAPLPAIAEVWVKENPLVDELVDYRVDCFVEFAQEGRSVTLDGEAPGFFEKQRIAERVPNAAELFTKNGANGTEPVDPSRNGTVRKGKKVAAEETEEYEAQLAKDVATSSRGATVVKNVRHRAAPRSTHADTTRGRGERLAAPGSGKEGRHTSRSRSRSTSRHRDGSRLQNGVSSAHNGGARRRNQRVVELEASPQKPIAAVTRERTLTESDRIKQAALSGNSTAAMESPKAASSTADRKEAKANAEDATPTPSPMKNGKMTWSRKAGAAAAQLAGEDGQSSDKQKSSLGTAKREHEAAKGSTNESDARSAHSAMLFALPPGVTPAESDAAPDSTTSRARQQRTFTSRRNPVDSSTLGRKSAARPLASDLFATSDYGGTGGVTGSSAASNTPSTDVGGDKKTSQAEARAESDDTATALARQRIARPRTGSAAALARRSRVTTSMYDPDLYATDPSSSSAAGQQKEVKEQGDTVYRASQRISSPEHLDNPASTAEALKTNTTSSTTTTTSSNRSEAFRRRIEALKSEVGDDWLRLLARGGGTAGDRTSALLLLSAVNEEEPPNESNNNSSGNKEGTQGRATGGSGAGGGDEAVTRVVRPKKSKKKMRTSNGEPSTTSSSRRASVDRTTTAEESTGTGGRRREARVT